MSGLQNITCKTKCFNLDFSQSTSPQESIAEVAHEFSTATKKYKLLFLIVDILNFK